MERSPERGTQAMRLHQALILASLGVPALLFAGAAWQSRKEVLREGRDTVARTAAIMLEHARKVFETQELALGQVNERIDGQDAKEIAQAGTSEFLRKLKGPLEQVVSVWVADEAGTVLAGSQPWKTGYASLASRDFFAAQRDADAGLYIGEPFVGLTTAMPSFALSRRRTGPDGQFIGTIHVSASPEYFRRFYAEAAPPYAHVAALMRNDGTILARNPPQPSGVVRWPPDSPLLAQMLARPSGGMFEARSEVDGKVRLWDYRKVGAYPAFVLFGVEHKVLMEQWHSQVLTYGLFAGGAALMLLGMSSLALRSALAEQSALRRLREESVQRLAAEQQLRHSQRLEAVGQLTGGIAHDFNNLMTAILGNLELIQRAAAGGQANAADKIARLSNTAMTAVLRGSRLTKSLLAFSRSQPLQTEAVDVNGLISEFADLLRQAVGAPVELELLLAPGLPRAWADGPQLEAAILNLCINARDAMPGGGHLTVATGLATLLPKDLQGNAEAQPGAFVRIRVEDTGTGMPDEVAAKAFEPFFTTKPIGQGTGLGLSQVFGFVRQLGGHVTIRTAPGAGTGVSLFLPLASAEQDAMAA